MEPQPALVRVLNNRFSSNPQVSIVPKGLASRSGTLEMSINSAAPVLSTFSDQWKHGRFADKKWDQTIMVDVTTFDQLVTEFGSPRYSKIDVEGFESEVIHGTSSKVGCISFEFTSDFLSTAVDILGYLSGIGYSRFNFSLDDDDKFWLDQWLDRDELSVKLSECPSRKFASH